MPTMTEMEAMIVMLTDAGEALQAERDTLREERDAWEAAAERLQPDLREGSTGVVLRTELEPLVRGLRRERDALRTQLAAAEKRTEAHRVEIRRLTDKIAALQEPSSPDRGADDRPQYVVQYDSGTGFFHASSRGLGRFYTRELADAAVASHAARVSAPAEARALAHIKAADELVDRLGAAKAEAEREATDLRAKLEAIEGLLADAETEAHAWEAEADHRATETAEAEARAREAEQRAELAYDVGRSDGYGIGLKQGREDEANLLAAAREAGRAQALADIVEQIDGDMAEGAPEGGDSTTIADWIRTGLDNALSAGIEEGYSDGVERGRAVERADVVAWLEGDGPSGSIHDIIDAIKAGDHETHGGDTATPAAPSPKSTALADAWSDIEAGMDDAELPPDEDPYDDEYSDPKSTAAIPGPYAPTGKPWPAVPANAAPMGGIPEPLRCPGCDSDDVDNLDSARALCMACDLEWTPGEPPAAPLDTDAVIARAIVHQPARRPWPPAAPTEPDPTDYEATAAEVLRDPVARAAYEANERARAAARLGAGPVLMRWPDERGQSCHSVFESAAEAEAYAKRERLTLWKVEPWERAAHSAPQAEPSDAAAAIRVLAQRAGLVKDTVPSEVVEHYLVLAHWAPSAPQAEIPSDHLEKTIRHEEGQADNVPSAPQGWPAGRMSDDERRARDRGRPHGPLALYDDGWAAGVAYGRAQGTATPPHGEPDDTTRPSMAVVSPEAIDEALAAPYQPRVRDWVVPWRAFKETPSGVDWRPEMAACLGQPGRVVDVDRDGDVYVRHDNARWWWPADALRPNERPTTDEPGEVE